MGYNYIFKGKKFDKQGITEHLLNNHLNEVAKILNINIQQEATLSEIQKSVLRKTDLDKDGNITPQALAEIQAERERIVSQAKANGTYMKAPNGNPSNLNEEQWVAVRTQRFKDWFGDWELGATEVQIAQGQPHNFKNFAEAKAWAKENIAKTYTNEETGGKGEIKISNTAITKYLSESSVEKSDNKDVHLSVLQVLPQVIKNGIVAERHADHNKNEQGIRSIDSGINENVSIQRVFGAVNLEGKTYRVKVTLKTDNTSKEPTKPHSYEATK